jgi:hypothetical protein
MPSQIYLNEKITCLKRTIVALENSINCKDLAYSRAIMQEDLEYVIKSIRDELLTRGEEFY